MYTVRLITARKSARNSLSTDDYPVKNYFPWPDARVRETSLPELLVARPLRDFLSAAEKRGGGGGGKLYTRECARVCIYIGRLKISRMALHAASKTR